MRLRLAALVLCLGGAVWPADLRDDAALGHGYYNDADFKKATNHFGAALRSDPNNAELNYWLGRSYEALADIHAPFYGMRSSAKARLYLERAATLAPANREYRRELFELLLDAADRSRTALRDAARMVSAVPESDPDRAAMLAQLEEERKGESAIGARLAGGVRALPRHVEQVVELPVDAVRSRREAAMPAALIQ